MYGHLSESDRNTHAFDADAFEAPCPSAECGCPDCVACCTGTGEPDEDDLTEDYPGQSITGPETEVH